MSGDAARAGGLLARALQMLEHIDEAEAVALEASALAGDDLRANISWRGVAAEVAARRGDSERALRIAREAVTLAASTDALMQQANAHISLGAVLFMVGDAVEGAREMDRAAEVCEAKGATVLAAIARAASGRRDEPAPTPGRLVAGVHTNTATRLTANATEAANRGDLHAVMACFQPGVSLDDRRRFVALEQPVTPLAETLMPLDFEISLDEVATRGDHLSLLRAHWTTDGAEIELLNLTRIDETPLIDAAVWFEPDELSEALAELDRMYCDGEGAAFAPIVRRFGEYVACVNSGDWGTARQYLADDFMLEDRRTIGLGEMNVGELAGNFDALRKAGRRRTMQVEHVPVISEKAMVIVSVEVGDVAHDSGRFEHRQVNVMMHDGHVFHGQEIFAADDLDAALARFRELS